MTHLTLYGEPRTKKNSARILSGRAGRPYVAPSKAFVDYEESFAFGKSEARKRPSLPV